jgi:hypothetical protein
MAYSQLAKHLPCPTYPGWTAFPSRASSRGWRKPSDGIRPRGRRRNLSRRNTGQRSCRAGVGKEVTPDDDISKHRRLAKRYHRRRWRRTLQGREFTGSDSQPCVHPALMAIFFSAFCASAVFGSVIVSTPFLNFASILLVSTPSGTRKQRWNEPELRSCK